MATQTAKTNVYEGMFLFPQALTSNLQDAVDHITQILDRADSEIISLKKWDERKLAYEIKGNKRGVYFLVFFKALAEKMSDVDRACNLSEMLLRSMITRTDHLKQEQIEAADGRAELADEIKLRAEQGEAASDTSTAGTSVVESRTDREARIAAAEQSAKPEKTMTTDADSGDDDDSENDDTAREPAVVGGTESESGA